MNQISTTGIAVCQKGFESFLHDELCILHNKTNVHKGNSHVTYNSSEKLENCVFPHFYANHACSIENESVSKLASIIFDFFIRETKEKKFSEGQTWFAVFLDSQKEAGLSRRTKSLKEAFKAIIKKRMSRVSRLMNLCDAPPTSGDHIGLFVFVEDFQKVIVSTRYHYCGQKRMSDDRLAPSRSYLKVEEAYQILGYAPVEGHLVVDLGAAPGGWSYSAAKRGATVYAIDNGPLKAGALQESLIIHKKTDAFKFFPSNRVDWLFCDLVEEPHHVIKLIQNWFKNGYCRFFIINLKFGHVNPIGLIQELESNQKNLLSYTKETKILHLYHDRNEVTLLGSLK